MVHALREARRVLKPGGLAIDLRPALAHRRVMVRRAGQAEPMGVMRETFDDDRAANRAVAQVVGQRLFKLEGRQRVLLERHMDGWTICASGWTTLPALATSCRRIIGWWRGWGGRWARRRTGATAWWLRGRWTCRLLAQALRPLVTN